MSLLFILILSTVSVEKEKLHLGEVVSDAVPHLMLFAKGIAIGGVLLWILEGTIREVLGPLIADSVHRAFREAWARSALRSMQDLLR
jgi:hypothetical protein